MTQNQLASIVACYFASRVEKIKGSVFVHIEVTQQQSTQIGVIVQWRVVVINTRSD
jgi:hypothetical protein